MADSIRGDGLHRAHTALAALVEDPERLNRARRRFSESPPSYKSYQSHNSTLSQSPNPPSEEQQRREERKWRLIGEHRASFPSNQFEAQINDERERIIEAGGLRIRCVPVGIEFYQLAEESIRKRWIEQGIWSKNWNTEGSFGSGRPRGLWKHEEPQELESESETDLEVEGKPPFSFLHSKAKAKPRRPKKTSELQRIAERRLLQEREREASRPFHQFVYQVSKEREWIQEVINAPKSFVIGSSDLNVQTVIRALAKTGWSYNESTTQTSIPDPPDINTMAYEMVKDSWKKKGVWNEKWGVLPGMSWKHEKPLKEMLREEMGDDAVSVQTDSLDGDRHRTRKTPPRSIFEPFLDTEPNQGAFCTLNAPQQRPQAPGISATLESNGYGSGRAHLRQNIFRPPSPTELNHVPLFDSLKTSPEELPSTTNSIKMPNNDANHSPVATNSGRRLEETQEDFRSSPKRMRRQEQPPQIERNVLGPVHLSKVSKARRKREPSPQRRRQVSELLSNAQPPLTDLNFPSASTESSPVPPRRSRRLEEEVERKKIAAVNPRNGYPQSQTRRARAGPKSMNSAKPQGVSKRHANAAWHRAK
ncbi:MAG: hypothetical protein LQ340_005266 [Diploschistes diacapsis]|nr:MAG: hypothetical protein LQ340_005266 [Diploschistes diacapsis]